VTTTAITLERFKLPSSEDREARHAAVALHADDDLDANASIATSHAPPSHSRV
jgi:hypothetical protein